MKEIITTAASLLILSFSLYIITNVAVGKVTKFVVAPIITPIVYLFDSQVFDE